MKKTLHTLTSLAVLAALTLNVSASNWYYNKNDSHTQPPIPSEYSYIENYGGYYLDRDHGDACSEKVIYLTFDAGYENGNVEKILDILKKHNAKGCFFILENLVKRNTDLVKRMFDEGHTVANHTMKHKNMSTLGKAELEKELCGLEKLCLDLTGHKMARLYRPPEGAFSEQNLKDADALGFKTIFWSFAYADWDNDKQPAPDAALSKLLNHLHNGEILLLHPTSSTNAKILDDFLSRLEKDGWRFGSLEELCGV